MDPLQFSLFFAALLIGYILIHLRLVRFERHLREMQGIRQLNERLNGVSQALESVRLDRLEDGLQRLHEDLETVVHALHRVERAAARGGSERVVTLPTPDASPVTPQLRVRSAVENRLRALGYQDLVFVTDLELLGGDGDEEQDVIVECVRRGMMCKGKVKVRGGDVVDVDLRSVSQGFP